MRYLTLILAICLLPAALFAQEADPLELHGSVAVSWYHFDDATDSELDYDRPAMRLNLKARRLFGSHLNARVRFRTRYDDRAQAIGTAPENEWRNRVYEVSLSYDNPDSPFAFQAGRIVSRDMGGVGYTDGVLLTQRIGDSWKVGALAGTRPDWETSDFQTEFTKYGAFVGFERGDRAGSRFEVSVAGVGEYHESLLSREFLYVRSSYHHERLFDVYGTAQLDVNRAWREDRAGESVTLSALFLRGRYRATETITLGAGYDTRENYYTHETRSIPDSLFTNAARYGARLSGDVKLPWKSRARVEVGMRDVENKADETIFYSGELSKRDLLFKRMRASLRFAGFTSGYATGANPSLRLSTSFRGGHSLHTSYGLYAYTVDNGGPERLNQWARIGGQAQLPARLYVSGEYQYDWGDDSEGHRLLGELGYRF